MTAQRIVLATGNAGKATEFRQMLGDDFDIVLQTELNLEAAEETGTTFLENALLKARFAAEQSGLPAIADDSGLEVDALNGEPGVYSARYAGEHASDADNNAKLLNALSGVPGQERGARFRAVVVLVRNADDPEPLIAEGAWEGRIAETAAGDGGFGYDPLFIDVADPDARSSAQLSPDEKNARSHRGKAVRDLCSQIKAAG